MNQITRRFVSLSEGQVHLRESGSTHKGRPIYLLHGQPTSSRSLQPLMRQLAITHHVIAPDTLGMGDSAPPSKAEPDIAYFADVVDQLSIELGHQQVDVYGYHTGAHIGVEWALAKPGKVRSLSIDGLAILSDADQTHFLKQYAPPQHPDDIGSQFNWAWHFVRDQMIFYPYFNRMQNSKRDGGTFDAHTLHEMTLDVLKSLETYHLPYQAAFRHKVQSRLPLLKCPTLCLAVKDDPLNPVNETIMSLTENCQLASIDKEGQVVNLARVISKFIGESS